MGIILLHKHLNRITHTCFAKQLQLLCRQVFIHQRRYPHLCELFRHTEGGVVDGELRLVNGDLGCLRRGLFGAVEN